MRKIEYSPLWQAISEHEGITHSEVAGYIADVTLLSRSHVSKIRSEGRYFPPDAIYRLMANQGWTADQTMHYCFGLEDRSVETEEKLREAEQIKNAISVLMGGNR